MRLSEIEQKARSIGIKDTWKFSRKELIREIQRKEGNPVCFSSNLSFCDQFACSWREDCLHS
jgi:hypothetical protein